MRTSPTPSIFNRAVAAGALYYERMTEDMASAINDAHQQQLGLGESFGRQLNQLIAAKLPSGNAAGQGSTDRERFLENSVQLLAEYVNNSSELYARCLFC